MTKQYKRYTKAQFERELILIRQEGKLRGWGDITQQLESESRQALWEFVYCFPTYNKDLDLVVYSSVDRRSGATREKGSDAVRVIYRLRVGGSVWYKKLKKHYRLETLFKNLQSTLIEGNKDCYKLTRDGWYKDIKATN